MSFELYPLTFTPILKEKIWGGTKLKSLLNKPILEGNAGESWEISTVEGDISIVAEGAYKGESLDGLIHRFPSEILGTRVVQQFGEQFPLLFKYIDAKEDLSIQVHPNDELARKRHNSFGKTEMWYVMQADPKARLIIGFKEGANQEKYLAHLADKTLVSILNEVEVAKGDTFFLETGTIHAIGAGVVLAEIQQTSDITYRVYDWDRLDDAGNERELHVDLALDAINYAPSHAERPYDKAINQDNLIVECQYFTTNYLVLDENLEVHKTNETFTVYMIIEGECTINSNGVRYSYKKGDTVLIPANLTHYNLEGKAEVLEIFIS